MLSYALLLAGMAASCWPADGATRRLRACLNQSRRHLTRGISLRRSPDSVRVRTAVLATAVLAVVAAVPVVGVSGAAGPTVLAAAVWRYHREQGRVSSGLASARRLAEALRTLVAELRAGALPAAAAESAAAESDPVAARSLRGIAATVRLGGDPATLTPGGPDGAGVNDASLRQVGRSWELARRYGLPYADVLDALRLDVAGRVRFAANAHAGMAGPRSSAVVLAALPTIGLALGEAMGAQPLYILRATSTGHFLLGLGCVLIALGLLWSSRLTRSGASL